MTDTASPSARLKTGGSLQWRLTLLITGLMTVGVAVFVGVSYRELRGNLAREASARARDTADRLAGLFAQSTRQRVADIQRTALDPAVLGLLRTPTQATREAALETMRMLLGAAPGRGTQRVAIWSAAGVCVAAATLPAEEGAAVCGAGPSEPGVAPLRQQGNVVLGETVVAIADGPARLGYLVVQRPVAVGPNADVLNGLVGNGAAVRVGNTRGDAWTDFAAPAAAPPVDLNGEGVTTYRDRSGDEYIGALAHISGTPWAVWVEFPSGLVIAPARAFLRRMIAIAIGFTAIALLVIWAFAGQIAAPLKTLTQASEAIAAGDFTRRVSIESRDEVGRLTAAFNTMADRVADAYQDLEERVRQRTARLEEAGRQLEQHARESREAREELDRFFSLSLDLLCIADARGQFLRVNPAWERVLGWTADELTAMPYDGFVHPDDRAATAAETAKLAAGGNTINFENRYRHRDGTYRWLSWKAASHAERGLIYAAARDVSDDKRVAREREQHVEALNTVNQELEAFSYSVSHDLRAPLRHITGFAALLTRSAEGALDSDSRRYLRVIVDAAARMGRLIDDLLAFSRVGRTPLARAMVDLDQLAREVREEVLADANGRTVRWTVASLPRIEADPVLLRLVLVNLLSNAVKYTATRAEAQIEIGARAVKYDETTFFVRDNGVGFDMQYSDKLFGVFQRLHSSDEFEGTGIGLATVRRIVQRHGGRVWAEGSVGAGATFYVSLPSRQQEDVC
jgi:PAS domain S-box-containing protein